MKIAIFYNLFFGGAKRVVFDQTKNLTQKGHEVHVYTTDKEIDALDLSKVANKIFKYRFDEGDNKVPVISRLANDLKIFNTLSSLHRKIALDIDKENYDAVIVHPDRLTQAPYILRFLKSPSFYICQEPLRIAYDYSLRFNKNVVIFKKIYERMTRGIRKQIDVVNTRSALYPIASCYHIRERMIEAYDVFPKVIYAGVDDKIFFPLNLKKRNQVFFVGDPSDQISGYDLASKALQNIPYKIRPTIKVLSWKKENRKRLSDKELSRIYNESMLTLCLTKFETFGLVPLESMACGTPVIATNICGHRETVLDNKTGFLVDYDSRIITDKILFLLKNKKKLWKMGTEAREHIKNNWSWEKRINDLESALLEVKK